MENFPGVRRPRSETPSKSTGDNNVFRALWWCLAWAIPAIFTCTIRNNSIQLDEIYGFYLHCYRSCKYTQTMMKDTNSFSTLFPMIIEGNGNLLIKERGQGFFYQQIPMPLNNKERLERNVKSPLRQLPLRQLFNIRSPYKHHKFLTLCLPAKMASLTVIRSIWRGHMKVLHNYGVEQRNTNSALNKNWSTFLLRLSPSYIT